MTRSTRFRVCGRYRAHVFIGGRWCARNCAAPALCAIAAGLLACLAVEDVEEPGQRDVRRGGRGGADIYNDVNPFHSTVEAVDWQKQELVYAPGAVRNHTLGTSRPLINENPEKWVTAGTVHIVAPGYPDPWRQRGEEADSQVFAGGAIIGSSDCGWTEDVVGRFFAVDEPPEYLDPASDPAAGYTSAPTRRVYRWYFIQKLEDRPEANADYAVMVQPSWLTLDAVTEKTAEGFTVTFSAAPPEEGRIDWMLLR